MIDDPYRAYNFSLLLDGRPAGQFVSASGLGEASDVINYREGGSGMGTHTLPGPVKYEPLVLRYGVSQDDILWRWFENASAGTVERKNVSVILSSNDDGTEATQWNLFDAWPASFKAGQLDASANEVVIDSLTLVYDRLERV